jgi:hypothetical protein
MKEVKDLLKDLLNTLDEAVNLVEDMEDFDQKSEILITIDSAFNDVSYRLSELS